MQTFDLIIIGGGAGAFASAIRANELGINTLMINAGLPLGGTCVNVGCLPSKFLIHASNIVHMVKNHNIKGLKLDIETFDFNTIIEDEISLVKKSRQDEYEKVLANLEFVTFIDGFAKFINENEISVNDNKFIGKKFIIATGSTANIPPIKNIKEVGYITHIEALQLKKLPKEMVIIGAGPIGLEFAQMYSRFGMKVTILQSGKTIFKKGESELISRLLDVLQTEGITIKTNVNVYSAQKVNDEKSVRFDVLGVKEELLVDEIFLAVGKTPNTINLELKNVGVKVDSQQAIIVNKFFQTNKSNIFAVGDVSNAKLRLETTAGREGTLVVENIFLNAKNKINYATVPYTIFTDPQFASVGLTEKDQLNKAGASFFRIVSFENIPKAQILGSTDGLIKMIVDPKTMQILGVHILAQNASELILQGVLLIKNRNTVDDLINTLPIFPSLSECFKAVALSFTKDLSKLSCCI